MDFGALIILLVLAGMAAYVQTVTGFAFGLLMMGGIGILGLMRLPDAAVIVGVLTLVNAVVVLARGWRDVAWPQFKLAIIPSLVALVAGYFLLEYLANTNLDGLRLLLGLVIVVASLQLAAKPHPLPNVSSAGSFVLAGGVGGLLGGLFSTAGPPLVYHFYRQPLPPVSIRETLVAIFAVNGVLRLALVGLAGNMPQSSAWWGIAAIPIVFASTYAARRWPPQIPVRRQRQAAFFLLLCSGLALAGPALVNLMGVRS